LENYSCVEGHWQTIKIFKPEYMFTTHSPSGALSIAAGLARRLSAHRVPAPQESQSTFTFFGAEQMHLIWILPIKV
jgi:hypothetical protein